MGTTMETSTMPNMIFFPGKLYFASTYAVAAEKNTSSAVADTVTCVFSGTDLYFKADERLVIVGPVELFGKGQPAVAEYRSARKIRPRLKGV